MSNELADNLYGKLQNMHKRARVAEARLEFLTTHDHEVWLDEHGRFFCEDYELGIAREDMTGLSSFHIFHQSLLTTGYYTRDDAIDAAMRREAELAGDEDE
jgi:hypothetical protein